MLLKDDPVHAFMPYPAIEVENAATGPLAGLTFGVKDIFDVAGYRTGCGNPIKLAQSGIATAHAPAVQALLEAGARFVGKTHTEELAWSLYGTNVHFGTPINPAAPDRVPGGSSSGSASAVAAGLCDFALGSDTGGSVRAPASFCAIYGLRPSHGAIALEGCMPLAPSFDTAGFFAREAAILRRVGDVLLPPDAAPSGPLRPLIATDLFDALSEAARAALAPALAAIAAAMGAPKAVRVHAASPAPLFAAYRCQQAYEAYRAHGAWFETFRPKLAPAIAERFAYAASLSAQEGQAAAAIRPGFAAAMAELLGEGGILIAPIVQGPAPLLASDPAFLDSYRQEALRFLSLSPLAGIPQIALPAGKLEGGPIGISLIGPRGSDRKLLALAETIKLNKA